MRISHEVAGGKASWLKIQSISPFHAGIYYPAWRPGFFPRKNVKQSTRGLDQADSAQAIAIAQGKLLFKRNSKTHPENVRLGSVDGVNDARFLVIAPHISTRMANDLESWITSSNAPCRFIYDRLCCSEQEHARTTVLADQR